MPDYIDCCEDHHHMVTCGGFGSEWRMGWSGAETDDDLVNSVG